MLDDLPRSLYFDDDMAIECRHCKWSGKIRNTKMQEVNSPRSAWMALAGREGWEFFCPKCGFMVYSFYTKMS